MPPEDDFTRAQDPVRRRRATLLGALVAVVIAGLAAWVWLPRGQAQPAARGQAQPVATVSPGAESPAPATFTPLTASPSPVPGEPVLGSGFSAVDDPATHQLVVFGGIDSYGTTWLWDGRRWSLARPPVSPPGRFRAAAAYDPLTRVVMLYGGRLGPGQVVDDTWAWDGSTWHELDAGTGRPPLGEASVMAWDDARQEMVLVNGEAGFGQVGPHRGGNTWIWSGARWVRQFSGDLPPGTFLVGAAPDPATGQLLAAGCCADPQGTTTTWAWNASGWHQVSTPTEPTFTTTLALDPISNRIVLFADASLAPGREMWSWSGRDWTPLAGARPPVFAEAAVSDTDASRLVLLGSFAEAVQGTPQPVHLWSWTGSAWRQLG